MAKYKSSWLEAGYIPGNLDAFTHIGDRHIKLYENSSQDSMTTNVGPPTTSETFSTNPANFTANTANFGDPPTTPPVGQSGPGNNTEGGYSGDPAWATINSFPNSGGTSFPTTSGIYSGSLSSLGNMVAMALSSGEYRIEVTQAGITASGTVEVGQTFTTSQWANLTLIGVPYPIGKSVPYCRGYLRTYWRDPTASIFGANTAIPALTGVFPDPFIDTDGTAITFPGNFVYYMDLAMQRLSGSNTWNNDYFINIFNQAIGWVLTTNNYTAALNNAQSNVIGNYGSTNYQDFVSQGFNKYQVGKALRAALGNLGTFVQTISDGHFGTSASVAKHLIDNGLGFVGDLSTKLNNYGIPYDDIYNVNYANAISTILKGINNQSQLVIVQDTLKTTVKDLQNLMDYTSLERCSGLSNDSLFKSLSEFGIDIYQKAANLNVGTGAGLVLLIDSVQSDVSANVEAISGNIAADANTRPLLSQTIIDNLRTYLPLGPAGSPVSLVNVVGTASGYYTDKLALVNDGIARLYASEKYGVRIRDTLTNISRYNCKYPLDENEAKTAANWIPVPPPVYGYNVTGTGLDAVREQVLITPGGLGYWETKLEAEKTSYYKLLAEIAADTTEDYPAIVKQINDNYLWCCRNLYWEITNYDRGGFNTSPYSDKSQYFAFISALPEFGADSQNIGTDFILYGLCQSNEAGDVMKTILGQGKTNQLLAESGVSIKNII